MDPNATPRVQETEVQITSQETEERTIQGKETRAQRDQMKALSIEIFGKSSRYQKMFEYDYVVTHEVNEVVPGENGAEDTAKKVSVPLLYNGSKLSRRKYRTVEQVIQVLVEFKAKRNEFIAQMKKQQEEAAAKKEQDAQLAKVQEELGGSALV